MATYKKINEIIDKIEDKLDTVIYILGGGGLLMAVALCGANILSWWFMRRRLAYTDELALIGLVWAAYVGMGLLFRTGGHCTMDFVVELFPKRAQVFLHIISDIMILIVSIIAVYFSWKLAIKSFNKKLVLTHVPYFYCDICVTIGYAHLLLIVVIDIIRSIVRFVCWDEEAERLADEEKANEEGV